MDNLARLFKIVGPGLLVAATGVGAGDLATGSFAGSLLGITILWAVLVGAFLKFVVTEGIARWQLATDSSLIEGVAAHIGRPAIWIFLPYLLLWSYFVGTAMMSGVGVTLHAIFPIFDDARHGKIVFGILASLTGLTLVLRGGYSLFEKIMGFCIGIMFVTVVLTAALLWPGSGEFLSGALVPRIPDFGGIGLTWTVALIGGVGGTVTVLCYGYWIREEGRQGEGDMSLCRIDLVCAYVMTAIFGLSVVIIGSNVNIEGGGATLLVTLSDQLAQRLGLPGRWLFLMGALGATFSSLLGVWQATPYIFADTWRSFLHPPQVHGTADIGHRIDTAARPYRVFLVLLSLLPIIGLFTSFREAQILYTVTGAFFVPLLAVALLLLNGRIRLVGARMKNGPLTMVSLFTALLFFLWVGVTRFIS